MIDDMRCFFSTQTSLYGKRFLVILRTQSDKPKTLLTQKGANILFSIFHMLPKRSEHYR
jgi:hypothetical protein